MQGRQSLFFADFNHEMIVPLCKISKEIFSQIGREIFTMAVSPRMLGDCRAGGIYKDRVQLGLEDLGAHSFEVD